MAAAAALVTGACLALAGCGSSGSGSGGGTTKITFWDDNGGPARTPVWQHIIDEFQKANPTIKVEYVGVPIAQIQQKYDTAIAGGGLPDVGGVSTAMLANLVPQKALDTVDDRINGSSLKGKLNEPVVATVRSALPDGKLYMVPMSTNIGMYWYRTDWFATAGLKAPETWSDFFNAVSKLTNAGKNQYGFTIRGGSGSIAQMLEVIYGQSGITSIFDDSGRATLNDPRNVAALEKLVSLYKKNTTPRWSPSSTVAPSRSCSITSGPTTIMSRHSGRTRSPRSPCPSRTVGRGPWCPTRCPGSACSPRGRTRMPRSSSPSSPPARRWTVTGRRRPVCFRPTTR
jgi:multiple sugar transport system substrate-binding protein